MKANLFRIISLLALATVMAEAATIEVKAKRKPGMKWKEHPTRTVEKLDGYRAKKIQQNKYGSRLDQQEKKTGFFYTIKKNDRWWLIDPDGYHSFNLAVVSVKPGRGPGHKEAFETMFPSKQEWASSTTKGLLRHGFNGTGAWSDDDLLRTADQRVSYCILWNFMSQFAKEHTVQGSGHKDYPQSCIRVFDPAWEKFCDDYAKKLQKYSDDPYLLGHFFDNELPLKPNMIDRFLKLPEDDHGYQAALSFVRKQHGSEATAKELTAADRRAFDDLVMNKYMGPISRAIKKVDSNHMLLGPRLHASVASLPVVGKYVDAFAFNLYGKWSPAEKVTRLASEVGKPIIITEFYVKGMDVPGLSNEAGAGWCVPTQKDRGLFYQNFGIELLETKVCIGWQWFKYLDNDPKDITTDPSNRDSNKGILNGAYQPYPPLLEKMKELNSQVYSIIDHIDSAQ